MEAYCVKCKEKREIQDANPVFTATGTPATSGVCPVCGTGLYRMGKTDAHEGMVPPKPMPRKNKKKTSSKSKKGRKNSRRGKLVIVESPAKARTVGRFLGSGYKVRASVGHVRDLLRSQISVDVENNFEPKYRVPNDKRPVVKELKSQASKVKEVYLATDPDREGEAIAWHLMESADIDPEITRRVVFHEITEDAIKEAFADPRPLNMDLVDAQQARRVMDRLVGYNLSPLLWRKVRGRLSAGRVQSVALRLVVEREREIDNFVPKEYWTISAELSPEGKETVFLAKLHKVDGEDADFEHQGEVEPVLADMETAAYAVNRVKRGERKRRPSPPFITSTLQQDASRRLRFSARRTMTLAQQLYEGIDLGEDANTGLITYMRTDSTNVSEIAQTAAREYILERYGERFAPKEAPKYRTRARAAQEAHEAIRPTSVLRTPQSIKKKLTRDQFRMYDLIWKRFVASQMSPALFDTISIRIKGTSEAHEYRLRASGSTLRFAGFLVLYEASKKGDSSNSKNGDTETPEIPTDLEAGEVLRLLKLLPEQHFTQPPPRFSEASLVASLEENGIGRPSTYAPILSTLQQRGYVEREQRRLYPTETGLIVNDLLTEFFSDVVDVTFTARMEENLDQIAGGDREWPEVIAEFYEPFSKKLAHAQEKMPEVKAEPELVGRACPECGHDLVIRWGRYGKFISCSNFPECRHTEPWLEKIGVRCRECEDGEVVERRTRRGRIFYGCSNYPECEFSSWKRPLAQPCPNCGGLLVQSGKERVTCSECENQYALEEIQAENVPDPAV